MDRSSSKRLNQASRGPRRASPEPGARISNLRSPPAQEGSRPNYELLILRHGIAVQREVGGASPAAREDAKRPLTAKGKKRLQQIAAGLRRLGCKSDWIVTSPLVRAADTAERVAAILAPRAPLDVCAALSPGGSAEELLSFLATHPNRKRILLVGHEPDLSALAARLMGAGAQANLAFKKGGCCLIRFAEHPSQSTGQLVWWLTPKLLRKFQ